MKKATTPQLPVSKKFYAALTLRIADTCRLLPDGAAICNTLIAFIGSYILSGKADMDSLTLEGQMIFTLLRPEIDRAVERSAAARRRAVIRKIREQEQTEQTDRQLIHRLRALHDSERSAGTSVSPATSSPGSGSDSAGQPEPVARNRRERRRQEQARRRSSRKRILPLTSPSRLGHSVNTPRNTPSVASKSPSKSPSDTHSDTHSTPTPN